MPASTAGRNSLCNGVRTDFTYLSIHTGHTSTTGANEATGGSPAYARVLHALPAAASGQSATTATVTLNLAAGTYFYLGLWSAVTSGTFGYGFPLGGYATQYALFTTGTNLFTLASHGLSNGDRVEVQNVLATSLPSGYAEETFYYVVNTATNTFQLSATLGGSAIAGGSSVAVVFQKCVPITLGGNSTITVAAGGLVLDATLI